MHEPTPPTASTSTPRIKFRACESCCPRVETPIIHTATRELPSKHTIVNLCQRVDLAMKSLNSLTGTGAPPRPRSMAAQWILPALFGILCYHILISWIYPPVQHFFTSGDQISEERTVSTGEFNWATVSYSAVSLVPASSELFSCSHGMRLCIKEVLHQKHRSILSCA
jgi:hypothetical protein